MDRFKRCTTGSRRVGNASVAEVLNQERCTQMSHVRRVGSGNQERRCRREHAGDWSAWRGKGNTRKIRAKI